MIRLLLIMILISFPAFAEGIAGSHNTKQPIEIDADALEVMQKDKTAVFSGNVVAKQGEMNLRADTMTVHYKPGGGDNTIQKIEVNGNVLLTTPTETARGQRGVYDTINDTVALAGNVVLTRDQNVLKGSKLVFNMATGRSKIVKDEGGRVRGLFTPQ